MRSRDSHVATLGSLPYQPLAHGADMMNRITPVQIRGARGMLDWSMVQLAAAAGLSVSTIKRVEMAATQPVSNEAHNMIQAALESEGVRFLDDAGEGAGIRLQSR